MNETRFPKGWNDERVKRLIECQETLSEAQQAAEDDAARLPSDDSSPLAGREKARNRTRRNHGDE